MSTGAFGGFTASGDATINTTIGIVTDIQACIPKAPQRRCFDVAQIASLLGRRAVTGQTESGIRFSVTVTQMP
jgi:hypothetical protein